MLTDLTHGNEQVPLNEVEAAQIGIALGAIARRRTRRSQIRRDDLPSADSGAPLLADATGWINLAL